MAFFATVALLVGLAFVGLALWLHSKARACKTWPSVEGVVLESRLDDAHLEFMKPVLRYRYAVAGQSHVGFRVAFAGYGISRDAMSRLIAPYPAGATVQVFYDPAKPSRAVLNADGKSDWAYWLVAGLTFCALAVYL